MALHHLFAPVKLIYDSKKEIAPRTYSFNFTTKQHLDWKAGQYGLFELQTSQGKHLIKPFSIASAPSEGVVTITTKIRPDSTDTFKLHLLKLKRGADIKLRGPIGRMHIRHENKQYAFLTTGIGITPFRSILKQMVMDGRLNNHMTLFYVGNKDSHLFRDELADIRAVLRNFKIIYIYKPERITGQLVEDTLGKEMMHTVYFLSGSPSLVRGYLRTLTGLGIPRKNIKRSRFMNLRFSFGGHNPPTVLDS
jgi:ferredoxin-NADP reductase